MRCREDGDVDVCYLSGVTGGTGMSGVNGMAGITGYRLRKSGGSGGVLRYLCCIGDVN